jgi:hypothetical protein
MALVWRWRMQLRMQKWLRLHCEFRRSPRLRLSVFWWTKGTELRSL